MLPTTAVADKLAVAGSVGAAVEVREFVDGYYQPETKREGTGHLVSTNSVPVVAGPKLSPRTPITDIMDRVLKPEKRAMRTLMTPEDMMSESHPALLSCSRRRNTLTPNHLNL